jgi:hypothetical protein
MTDDCQLQFISRMSFPPCLYSENADGAQPFAICAISNAVSPCHLVRTAALVCNTVIWLQVHDEVRHPSLIPNVPGKAASAATAGAKHGTEELLEVRALLFFGPIRAHFLNCHVQTLRVMHV